VQGIHHYLTTGPAAYLLRLQSIHKRHHRYVALHNYFPGKLNVLADACSRRWELSDDELLTLFNISYPQTEPWTLCHLQQPTLSALTCALFRKLSDLASLLNAPKHSTTIGIDGMRFASAITSIPSSATGMTPTDPVPTLQIFDQRYRDGRLAPSGNTVRSRTVEDATRAVGQKFARMGTKDIRKDATGGIDFRIQQQLRSYKKDDAPPSRVKPIPITIILYILHAACGAKRDPGSQAIADIIAIAFFYILRPGEYAGTTTDNAAFTLDDVELHVGDRRLNIFKDPIGMIKAATSVSLAFTTQKNGS